MQLLVGLGNPGDQYKTTRHNVGFMVADRLVNDLDGYFKRLKKCDAEIARLPGAMVAKPQTFMNLSGRAIQKILKFFRFSPEKLWVIHDDLDLPLGEFKFHFAKGPKIHNGLTSIEETLTTPNFWRVRIGIDNRTKINRIPGDIYVLEPFTLEERRRIKIIVGKVVKELIKKSIDTKDGDDDQTQTKPKP